MKRVINKVLFYLMIIFCFLMVACANALGGTYYISNENKAKLNIYAISNNSAIDFSSSSECEQTDNSIPRTIMPHTSNASDLHFYLWGKNKITGQSFPASEVKFHSTNNSKVGSVLFDLATNSAYDLYLACTQDIVYLDALDEVHSINQIKSKAIYMGSASADLRYQDEVNFYLTPYLVTSYGKIQLKLFIPWDLPEQYNVTVGLYDANTDKLIYTNDPFNRNSLKTFFRNDIVMNQEPEYANYVLENVKPGTYNLKLKFESSVVYEYSENVIILGNQTSKATRAIPKIIDLPPNAAPSNFVVAYKNPENADNDYYSVEFSWNDNSINENYFQLEILDISKILNNQNIERILNTSESLSNKNQSWEALRKTSGVNTIVFNPQNFGDSSVSEYKNVVTSGALCSNNSSIIFNFLLGKKYLARLCAVNQVGKTDYVYANIYEDVNRKISQNYSLWPNGSMAINCFRVSYNLNGGRYYDSENPAKDISNNLKLINYGTYNPEHGLDLLKSLVAYTENGIERNGNLYKKNQGSFAGWKINGEFGELCTYETYTGFENIKYYATYDGVSSDGRKEFITGNSTNPLGEISVFVEDTENLSSDNLHSKVINIEDNYSFVVNRTETSYLHIAIRNPYIFGTLQTEYEKIKLKSSYIYGQEEYLTGKNSSLDFINYTIFTINLNNSEKYPSGSIFNIGIELEPRNKEEKNYNYNLTYKLQD